jgi:hypothetical protein
MHVIAHMSTQIQARNAAPVTERAKTDTTGTGSGKGMNVPWQGRPDRQYYRKI